MSSTAPERPVIALAAAAALVLSAAPALAQEDPPCCTEDDYMACQDGLWCTGEESCNCWGDCEPGIPRNCDDGNWCTVDRCVEDLPIIPGTVGSGYCEHRNECEPCEVDEDCDDLNECTVDRCVGDVCYHHDVTCNDSNICTEDTCDPAVGCVFTWIPGCCLVDGDCDDGLWCNGAETCDTSVNECVDGTNPCAGSPLACVDGTSCNEATDSCDPLPGWCLIGGVCYSDGDRNPANVCEACMAGVDQHGWSPAPAGWSCTGDAIACTDDVCDGAGSCVHPVWPGWCFIDGVCWADGTRRPANACEACMAGVDQYAWSDAPAGWACPGDTIACTADECDGAGSCEHPVLPGWCLFGTVCIPDWTTRPGHECEWCDSSTSTVSWTNKPPSEPCTDDGHACTDDHCDGAGNCIHPFTSYVSNDRCPGSALTMSGTGLGRSWSGTGDTYCARDDYSSPCGGAGGTDAVHYFDIPVEYETYRYRAMVGGPAGFNSVEYFYAGNTVVPGCGQSSAYVDCNDNGPTACWSASGGAPAHDTNDSCWYTSMSDGGLVFPNGRNWAVVDTIGTGDTYQVKVDRTEAPDTSTCVLPLPEIQMGGTWTGRTDDATTDWWTNMPYCVGVTGTDCMYFNIYYINHMNPPWDGLDRGYVVSTDGTLTPGGFNNVLFFAVNRCDSPWYLLSCDNDTYHYRAGPAGRGSQIVTGPVPAGRLGGIVLTGYGCYESGNYTMTVEVDDDGDGVPNGSDGSGLLLGSSTATSGGDAGKRIPSWPWGEHGYSSAYPHNWLGACGQEVFHYYDNPTAGRDLDVYAFPRVRGDVWAGQPSWLWDMRIWVYFPTGGLAWCDGWGWFWASAGHWYSCDRWGAGEWENMYVQDASASRYWVAIDSWSCTPSGGWYSVELR